MSAYGTILSKEIVDMSPLLNHTELECLGIFDDEGTEVIDGFFLDTLKHLQGIYHRTFSGDASDIESTNKELTDLRAAISDLENEVLKGNLLNLINYIASCTFGVSLSNSQNYSEELNDDFLKNSLESYEKIFVAFSKFN